MASNTFAHVLIGTDLSETDSAMVHTALALTARLGSASTLVHVASEATAHDTERFRELRQSLGSLVESYAAPGQNVRPTLGIGTPHERLIELGQQLSADLIIVSASQKSATKRFFLGSTADALLKGSTLPVLFIGPFNHERFNQVVVGVDYTPACEEAVRLGARMALSEQGALEVIHVSSDPGEMHLESGGAGRSIGGVRAKSDAQLDLEAFCQRVLPSAVSSVPLTAHHMVGEHPDETLTNHAIATHTNLIVMGTHDRGVLARFLGGSTGERVLHKVPCSLMAIRIPDGDQS